jgi:hypothetical protein
MDKFIKLAQTKGDNFTDLIEAVNEMVLDETGQTVMRDGLTLPTAVMTRVIGKVVETLGK